MIVEKPRPNVFCETTVAWRHEDGTESPITDAYVGPEEYSSAGPFFSHNFGWALHRDAARLTLLVRRWKSRSGYPDTDAEREYESPTVYVSVDHGRTWREDHADPLGPCVASRW
jgi:hypothetical protein